MTSRTPGESVAHGFSQKTCLLAFTAAVRCCGRKPGRRGQQHDVDAAVDHLVVGIEPEEGVVDLHAVPEPRAALQPRRRPFDDLASSMSATAVSSLLGSAVSACAGRAAAAAAGADQADLDGVGDRLAGDDAGETGRDRRRRPSRSS